MGAIPYDDGNNTLKISINVLKHLLEVENSKGGFNSFELSSGLTVAEFFKKLSQILKEQKIPFSILDKPFDLNIGHTIQFIH